MGSIPGPGTEIPHAAGQQSFQATTREARVPQRTILQPNKYFTNNLPLNKSSFPHSSGAVCCAQFLSHVQLFLTHQAPLSMGFPRQEYWSGLPFSSPGNLPDPGIEPTSPALAGRFFTAEPPGEPFSLLRWDNSRLLPRCSQEG